jgi:hypothetical protein
MDIGKLREDGLEGDPEDAKLESVPEAVQK